jgi:predicted DNA-binding protein YlxM (UPF0122 family)
MARRDKKIIDLSDLPKIKALAGLGLSVGEIADIFSMSRATFYQRIAEMPDISKTISEGKATAKNNLLAKSYKKAMGEGAECTKSGDNEMLKYLLSRVHGLTETQVLEHVDKSGIENYTIEELEEEIRKLDTQNESLRRRVHPN